MQILSFTVLPQIKNNYLKKINFQIKLQKHDILALNVNKVVFFYDFLQNSALNIVSKNHAQIELLNVFTKTKNLNKLYLNSNKNLFLSPGIILRFIKALSKKYLKKKHKCWSGAVQAVKLLINSPVIVFFQNLFGKKFFFFEKLLKNNVKIIWVFIQLFYLNYHPQTKPKKRIKRWVKKKYFQLSVNEN